MSYTIKLRRDTAANWTSVNPVLADGEAGFEEDTNQLKIGNGSTAWNGLEYIVGEVDLSSVLLKEGSNLITLDDSETQFLRVNIPDDLSDTALWPDRMGFFFNTIRTGYFNEYGELRARPGKPNTVAFRAFSHAAPADHNAHFAEFTRGNGDGLAVLGISDTAVTAIVPVVAPNIGAKVLVLNAADAVPVGTVAGTVIFRRP